MSNLETIGSHSHDTRWQIKGKSAATGKPFKEYHLSLGNKSHRVICYQKRYCGPSINVAVWEVTQTKSARLANT